MRTTIAQRMIETGGRPTGFDYMRLILAILIVCWHSVLTSYGEATQTAFATSAARPLVAILLPAFFTLSGFLVAGSLERCRTVGLFLGLRALRIYPALVVESLISALILGPLLTTHSLVDYVSAPQFRLYFLNILGDPHYFLPGVFQTAPYPKVNGQLWTIPYELRCYAVIAGLAFCGVAKRPAMLVITIVAYLICGVAEMALNDPLALMQVSGPVPGWLLLVSFLIGVLVYQCGDRIPWKWSWGCASLAAGLFLLSIPFGQYLAIAPIAYATVFFGLTNPAKTRLLKGADYSYGIFLYGYVIQQTFMALAPWGRHWWINIAVSVPAATAVAALSWHLVEKPALGLKSHLSRAETWWLARRATSAAAGLSVKA